MIPIPSGVRVWLATGHTDLRKGFASLSLQVQEVLRQDPLGGHLFCLRGRRGSMTRLLCMRLGASHPAQTSTPAYCETGRPISGEHLV